MKPQERGEERELQQVARIVDPSGMEPATSVEQIAGSVASLLLAKARDQVNRSVQPGVLLVPWKSYRSNHAQYQYASLRGVDHRPAVSSDRRGAFSVEYRYPCIRF